VTKALIDEVVPKDLASILSNEDIVVDEFPDSWRSLPDGAVITKAAGQGYDWLLTCDKRMAFQQNLAGNSISVLVLPTTRVPDLERIKRNIHATLRKPLPGHFVFLDNTGAPFGKPSPHLVGPAKRTP
jgi:hypothetical protein